MLRWVVSSVVPMLLLASCTRGDPDRASASGPSRTSQSGPTVHQRTSEPGGTIGPSGVQALQLTQPRAVHHATVLDDGRVLLTGGCASMGCEGFELAQRSDIFDPRRGTFEQGPTMLEPRASGTATLLQDGRVLLTGGYPGEGQGATDSAELYDPSTDSFSAAASMSSPRANQSATMLPDGRVLIAGGNDAAGAVLDTTEYYDPGSDEFVAGPRLTGPRTAHLAVALGPDVLLIGGTDGTASGRALASTDLLRAATWAAGPDLLSPRVKLGAAAINRATVFVVGGAASTEGRERLSSSEILSLRIGASRYGPDLSEGRYKLDGAVARLPDDRIAIAGGDKLNIYDPRLDTITTLDEPSMGTRSFISATVVHPGSLLVAGGYDPAITPTDQAWLIPIE